MNGREEIAIDNIRRTSEAIGVLEILKHIASSSLYTDVSVTIESEGKSKVTILEDEQPDRLSLVCSYFSSVWKANRCVSVKIVSRLKDHRQGCLDELDCLTGFLNQSLALREKKNTGGNIELLTGSGCSVCLKDIFQSRAVFLICNGPSFAFLDHSQFKVPGVTTMTLNNGGHGFRSNLWMSADAPQRFMRSIWEDSNIQKFVPVGTFGFPVIDRNGDRPSTDLVSDFPNVFGYRRNGWFCPDRFLSEPTFNWGNLAEKGGGRSVMLPALKMLYYLGFRTIYLVACDFKMTPERGYWFDEERSRAAIYGNNKTYGVLRGHFDSLKEHFEEAGLKVFNTNPVSELESFPHVDLTSAIDSVSVGLNRSTRGMYKK